MVRNRKRKRNRKGNIVVLSAFFMIAMLGMVAFGVDVGYLLNATAELQRAADAAALAGAYQLISKTPPSNDFSLSLQIAAARQAAVQYAALNKVCRSAPVISANDGNGSSGDVVLGTLATPTVPGTSMTFNDSNRYNAVQVMVSRTASVNGEVPLFFAKALGTSSAAASARATAAIITNFSGFQMPADGSNLGVLPFALDQQTWNSMMEGNAFDLWSWDANSETVRLGGDGVPEGNLYPQGTGSPGNRGTVDIGSPSNSTADINRQILYGANASDLSYLGGKLALDSGGILLLNGDTGISAGVKDNLSSIIGEPRIIPIFSNVSGPGNNAQYTIVEFVCVRILYVQLTGKMSSKSVVIQPATMVSKGGIPATTSTQLSAGIYSLPFLVQ